MNGAISQSVCLRDLSLLPLNPPATQFSVPLAPLGDLFFALPTRSQLPNLEASLVRTARPVEISQGSQDKKSNGGPWLGDCEIQKCHILYVQDHRQTWLLRPGSPSLQFLAFSEFFPSPSCGLQPGKYR